MTNGGPENHIFVHASRHVQMWEHQNALPVMTCDCPLDCKEIKPVKHKGNQLLRCVRITDAEAESLKLWLPEKRTDSLEKTLILREHWDQEEKWVREEEEVL